MVYVASEESAPYNVLTPIYQRKILYVFDPRAMHNIVVKDQYSYEQPDWFIE